MLDITTKLIKPLTEARYLCTDNTPRYRTILRFFYRQYEKMNFWLYKEQILDELLSHKEFKNYTMELLKQDLNALVEWQNLIPRQDTSRVSTVEEFKNKQYLYKLSEYTVEIERMTLRLESLSVEAASLEPSLLEKLRDELSEFSSMIHKDEKAVGSWWRMLNADFKRLNQNSQDYIGTFYTLKSEEMMKTHEFIIYKEKFVDYLRDFIKGLQYNTSSIESIISDISYETTTEVLQKVLSYELSIPKLDNTISKEDIYDNINGKWISICDWFMSSEGRKSDASSLLDMTNEIIRKITRFASQISESRNSAANRKEEYHRLAELFSMCKDMDEAHKLSASCFGIFSPKHIKGDIVRGTDSINSGIFDEPPYIYSIKPRVRVYREKVQKTAIKSNHERKAEMLAKIMKQREDERALLNSYIKDDCIDFSTLPKIEPRVRTSLLSWLTKGITSKGSGKTESGRTFRLEPTPPAVPKASCILKCTDGDLEMPAYKIIFDKENA